MCVEIGGAETPPIRNLMIQQVMDRNPFFFGVFPDLRQNDSIPLQSALNDKRLERLDTLVFESVYPRASKRENVTMVFGVQNQARLNHGPFSSNHLIRSWGKGKGESIYFLPE
jgi:hypothetical protein